MEVNAYVKAFGISYAGTIPKIRKSDNLLQPIFEAFTNALEAIQVLDTKSGRQIIIRIKLLKSLVSAEEQYFDFDSIEVEDNGIGFTDVEFERIENLNDTGKGFINKGSGRIQFLHFFDKTFYKSTYRDSNSTSGFKERQFTLSKGDAFIRQNAIIHYDAIQDAAATDTQTIVTFKTPLTQKELEFYKALKLTELKDATIQHYMAKLCDSRDSLPSIIIQRYVSNQLVDQTKIESSDIPQIDSTKDINVHYSKVATDGRSIERTDKLEVLNLKAFKIPKERLDKNALKLISKGEVASPIKLDSLLPDDHIDGIRYLFLLSGDYIDNKDSDTRGKLNIPTEDDLKKTFGDSLFSQEDIVLEDIHDIANSTILATYEEIRNKNREKENEIDRLKEMFLLNPESIRDAKIRLSDTEERILEKVYQSDAKLIAKKDAEIKRRMDALDKLNPSSADFRKTLDDEIKELAKVIPLQNKVALTHYVARRKLVLKLFGKVLDRELTVQKNSERDADEKLLHNLLFQQSSNDPEKSDLWIINEDFIYFSGVSESTLSNAKFNGNKIFNDKFTEEEEKYLRSQGENRKLKRPDVLLFPSEGKCIIVEFKDPTVNVSEHLDQTNFYASLIRNFTKDELQITTFYSYLIGENIEPRDVRGRVSAFEHSYQFDYLYRPAIKVIGENGRSDGSIYSEVIKYSTLLKRAQLRNDIFIRKLTS